MELNGAILRATLMLTGLFSTCSLTLVLTPSLLVLLQLQAPFWTGAVAIEASATDGGSFNRADSSVDCSDKGSHFNSLSAIR